MRFPRGGCRWSSTADRRTETNKYPFLISARGFTVLPITTVTLDYGAPQERISTGVPRLDHMLSGGLFRGSTVLASGRHRQDHAGSAPDRRGVRAGRAGTADHARGIRRGGNPQHALGRPGSAALGRGGPAADLGSPADRVRPEEPPGDRVQAAHGARARRRGHRRDRQPRRRALPPRGDLDAGPQGPPVQGPGDHRDGEHPGHEEDANRAVACPQSPTPRCLLRNVESTGSATGCCSCSSHEPAPVPIRSGSSCSPITGSSSSTCTWVPRG